MVSAGTFRTGDRARGWECEWSREHPGGVLYPGDTLPALKPRGYNHLHSNSGHRSSDRYPWSQLWSSAGMHQYGSISWAREISLTSFTLQGWLMKENEGSANQSRDNRWDFMMTRRNRMKIFAHVGKNQEGRGLSYLVESPLNSEAIVRSQKQCIATEHPLSSLHRSSATFLDMGDKLMGLRGTSCHHVPRTPIQAVRAPMHHQFAQDIKAVQHDQQFSTQERTS
jgi:hypothetical protein